MIILGSSNYYRGQTRQHIIYVAIIFDSQEEKNLLLLPLSHSRWTCLKLCAIAVLSIRMIFTMFTSFT